MLPKSFQDAIVLIRKSRCNDLWIDSLGEVLPARTATAAPNSDAGLFLDRDLSMLTPIEVPVESLKEGMSIYDTIRSRVPSGRYW
jgi:hypothetical protein